MNINNSTRIRVSTKLTQELSLNWWDNWNLKIKMRNEYEMYLTSKRNYSFYFQPKDKQKCMLFIMAYGHLILNKKTR